VISRRRGVGHDVGDVTCLVKAVALHEASKNTIPCS
jgi:hypothetical protein